MRVLACMLAPLGLVQEEECLLGVSVPPNAVREPSAQARFSSLCTTIRPYVRATSIHLVSRHLSPSSHSRFLVHMAFATTRPVRRPCAPSSTIGTLSSPIALQRRYLYILFSSFTIPLESTILKSSDCQGLCRVILSCHCVVHNFF
jgi:hypothetical protein